MLPLLQRTNQSDYLKRAEKEDPLSKIVWQSFSLLISGKRCKSPWTVMICLNSTREKTAYEGRLAMGKCDLHEHSVTALCVQ